MIKKKSDFICIILARGGSKGIKNKNLININNKPLLYWTIKSAKECSLLDSIWVSSDSKKILTFARQNKVKTIFRPKKYASDNSTSESAWRHAILSIQKKGYKFKNVLAPQVTSPIRDKKDFQYGIEFFRRKKLDSMFSSLEIKDHFIWKKVEQKLKPNYNHLNRKRRQKIKSSFLENGSFYCFNKSGFLKNNNRLFGKFDTYTMKKKNSFQIDDIEDISIAKAIFNI